MTTTVDNITVYGPARVFIAPKSTAAPANTVALGTAWGGSWTDLGSTADGSKVNIKHSTDSKEIKVDQYTAPVKQIRQSDTVEVTLPLSEVTLQTIAYMVGNGTYTAGSTESTFVASAAGGQITPMAIGLEGWGTGYSDTATTRYRRYIFWACVPTDGFERNYGREETPGEMKLQALADLSQAAGQELYKIINRQVA